jgi:hypothetical protein
MINLLNSNYISNKQYSKSKNKSKNKKIHTYINSKSNSKSISFKNLNKKSFIKNMKYSEKLKAKGQKYKPRSVESYCGTFYKKDILGKVNKKLYDSCKINKYCRKNKCDKIDEKMIKEQENKFGKKYNMIIQSYLRRYCPLTVTNKNRQLCEKKTLKKFYEKYDMDDLYNKLVECDKITCAKEKKIFYTNLFRTNQIKLKKKQKIILAELEEQENPEPDMDLIVNGDL